MTIRKNEHARCRWVPVLMAIGLLAGALQGKPLDPQKSARVLSKADLASLPMLGDSASEVVIVEFADFECPYCRQHAGTTMPKLVDKYVRTGKVRYVFAHFPIDDHANAKRLATLAQCAHAQGKFWPLHEQLFRMQGSLSESSLDDLEKQVGLDTTELARCVRDPKISATIDASRRLGTQLGVEGTPWFVIGRNTAGHWSEVSQVFGARPAEFFAAVIDKLLDQDSGPRG
jgi:protein-disulfide isomerase